MKYAVLCVFLCMLCLSCVHRQEIIEKGTSPSLSFITPETSPEEKKIEFSGIDVGVNPEKSLLESNGLYKIEYTANISIANARLMQCFFYDESGNEIYASGEQSISGMPVVTVLFNDYLLYKEIGYKLLITGMNNETAQFEGMTTRENYPGIKSCLFGPIVTKFEDNARITELIVECVCKAYGNKPEFVRVIPPTEDFFWELPVKDIDNDEYTSFGRINYSSHKEYIDNGNYTLQVSFGKWGIVQRIINVADIYGNKKGPNYGFSIPKERKSSKEWLEFDISELDDVSSIDMLIYMKNVNNELISIGSVSFPEITEKIKKDDILKFVRGCNGDFIELKNNKEYYYQLAVKSKEKNTIRYLSLSEIYRIVFYGFKLF